MSENKYELQVYECELETNDIREMESELIDTDEYDIEGCRRSEEKIMGFYFEILKRTKRIPYLYEVFEAAECYNYSIYDRIAKIEVPKNYDISILSEEEYDDKIEEFVTDYIDMISYNGCYSNYLDYFSAKLLDREGMSYLSDCDDFIYDEISADIMGNKMSELGKDSKIVINDAQNVMFHAFLEKGFTTCCGDLVYTRQDSTALTIGR